MESLTHQLRVTVHTFRLVRNSCSVIKFGNWSVAVRQAVDVGETPTPGMHIHPVTIHLEVARYTAITGRRSVDTSIV